jgi:two-component system sensor histidine kinase DevS
MKQFSIRLAPLGQFYSAVAASLVVAAIMLGLATDQRWLGLEVTAGPAQSHEALRIDRVATAGPADTAGILALPDTGLIAITGRDGTTIRLEKGDLIDEPDTLATYEDMADFFTRQDRIATIVNGVGGLNLEIATPGGTRNHLVQPQRQRPVTSLPPTFWMQIAVGLAGFWIGAWIWTLRRGEWAPRFLALAGLGLMVSAFPAAVYSTRELSIPGGLFATLSTINHAGALTFGVGMIGLFLVYPRMLVRARWLILPALIFGTWQMVDMLRLADGPGVGIHLGVVLAMLSIVVLVAIQFRATRGNPRDRAALTWLGLAVVVGAGAFVTTVIAPSLLGIDVLIAQGEAFLFFLLIYVGVALGVARFQLFQLDEWAFRILFYLAGVLLLVALDALLIFTIVDERAPAFALSLLIVALTWLPLRDMLARIVLGRREPDRENLFRQVMDVALTPPGEDQQMRWRDGLIGIFNPLSIERVDDLTAPALVNDGMALELPGVGALSGMRLTYADTGRKLFSPRDLALAGELSAMLANALESREAYEKGVAEERSRIARDIHDNIGVQLMGALHSTDYSRKDMMIRETLTDLRDIINNASRPNLSFEEMLADLRAQISEHLFAAGVEMQWSADSEETAVLPLQAAHTLRSIIREAVQNALKHADPARIGITIALRSGVLSIAVSDDGKGFDPGAVVPGNGLENMRARVTSLNGEFVIEHNGTGTHIRASIPVIREKA